MSKGLEMLPPDVKAMLREEQARVVAPAEGRDRLAERLSVAVPGFGAPHVVAGALPAAPHAVIPALPASGMLKAGVVKAILVVAIGGGVATTVGVVRHAERAARVTHDEPTAVTATVPAAASRALALPPSVRPAEVQEAEPLSAVVAPPIRALSVGSAPLAHGAPTISSSARSPAASLREERVLLDAARDAIVHGVPEDALGSLATHAARFPQGVLAEERVALQIRALARLGRKDEAQALLSTMRASYPKSFLLEGASNDVDTIP